MLQKAGKVDVRIIFAIATNEVKHPAKENEVNADGEPVVVYGGINVFVADDAGNQGKIQYEFSNRNGLGINADKNRTQITTEALQRLNPALTVDEIAWYLSENCTVEPLIGIRCSAVSVERFFVDNRTGLQRSRFVIKHLNPIQKEER